MKSRIAQAIDLQHQPVALLWSDSKSEGAVQFNPGKWGCVMWLAAGAARGKAAACDRQTFGCVGGGVGLGFGDQYVNFPGGKDCFCHFLSSGNANWEQGRKAAEQLKPFMRPEAHDNFLHGERYRKTPERVESFIHNLPITEIPKPYVVFKPLDSVDEKTEKPEVVIFFVNPDQFAALTVLANYDRPDNENVLIPFAAGCQALGIYPYREAQRQRPRAVAGLIDLSARLQVRNQLGENLLSLALPLALYREMEANVSGSFLQRHTWQALAKEDS